MKQDADLVNDNELFSCIVPVLNEEDTIDQFIKSIHAQDYRPIELLIIDGGSSDGTLDTIFRQISTLNDVSFYIRLFMEKDYGELSSPGNARNIGLNNSLGEYILFIDSDTVFMDEMTISRSLCGMGNRDYIFLPFNIVIDTKLEKNISKLLDAGIICIYKRKFIGDVRFISTLGFGEDREFNFRLFKSVTQPSEVLFAPVVIGRHFPHTKNEVRSQNKWYGRTILRYLKVIYHLDTKDFFTQLIYIVTNIFLSMSPILLILSILISPILAAIVFLSVTVLVMLRSQFRVKSFNDFVFATWYYIYCGVYFTKGLVSSLHLRNRIGRY